MTKSELDEIKGIGPVTKDLLLKKIGSIEKIRKTPVEEIEKLIGVKKTAILTGYLKKQR